MDEFRNYSFSPPWTSFSKLQFIFVCRKSGLKMFLFSFSLLLSFSAMFWLPMALTHLLFLRGALNVEVVGSLTSVGNRREQLSI